MADQIEVQNNVVDIEKMRAAVTEMKRRRAAYKVAFRETLNVDPRVEIKILGETFTLSYTVGSCREIFKETGKNPAQGQVQDDDLDDPELLIPILFHGLVNRGDMKREELDFIPLRRLPYVKLMVSEALSAIMPDMDLVERLAMEGEGDRPPLPLTSGSAGSGQPAE